MSNQLFQVHIIYCNLSFYLHIVNLFLPPIFYNSHFITLAGVAIGGGWQAMVAYINLGCYYVFGLPFGCILGYLLNLGVKVIFFFRILIRLCQLIYIFFTVLNHIIFQLILIHWLFLLLKGIWSGMISGTALQTLLLCIILYKTNWNKEVTVFYNLFSALNVIPISLVKAK